LYNAHAELIRQLQNSEIDWLIDTLRPTLADRDIRQQILFRDRLCIGGSSKQIVGIGPPSTHAPRRRATGYSRLDVGAAQQQLG
jgi:hypothetical protein